MAKTLIGNIKGPKGDTGATGATGEQGYMNEQDVAAVVVAQVPSLVGLTVVDGKLCAVYDS